MFRQNIINLVVADDCTDSYNRLKRPRPLDMTGGYWSDGFLFQSTIEPFNFAISLQMIVSRKNLLHFKSMK